MLEGILLELLMLSLYINIALTIISIVLIIVISIIICKKKSHLCWPIEIWFFNYINIGNHFVAPYFLYKYYNIGKDKSQIFL